MDAPLHKAGTAPLAGAGVVGLAPLATAPVALSAMTRAPQKEENPGVITARALDNQQQNTNTEIVPIDLEKLKSTLEAKLALHHGIALFELADGGFIASKWNLTRHLVDLHAVAAFARQLGGA